MKSFSLFAFALLLVPTVSYGMKRTVEVDRVIITKETPKIFDIQLRGGYFYPASAAFRDVYRNGGAELEAEANIYLHENVSFWTNFNYFHRHGKATGLVEKTTVDVYPISFGLKGFIPLASFCSLYIGGGASCTFADTHDTSAVGVVHTHEKNKWGGVAKSGILFDLPCNLFIDVFADGYYTKANLFSGSHNVGGLRTGVGFGVAF